MEATNNQFYLVPNHIDVSKLKMVGYLQGDKISTSDCLNLNFFDTLQYIRNSDNVKNGKRYVHLIGYAKSSRQYTIIIAQEDA